VFRRSLQFAVLVLCIAAACFTEIPRFLDRDFNKLVKKPPYAASEKAINLHKQLTITDLHADSLLWGRDLLERSQDGHVDIPRLADGNVTLQVFSLPTKTPRGLNIESNDDKTDSIYWLAIVDRWPPRTWNSLTQRTLYQARRLHDFARGSQGGFTVIETSADLSAICNAGSVITASPPDSSRSRAPTPWTASSKISTSSTAPDIA
jgi:membrane dipeptidase